MDGDVGEAVHVAWLIVVLTAVPVLGTHAPHPPLVM